MSSVGEDIKRKLQKGLTKKKKSTSICKRHAKEIVDTVSRTGDPSSRRVGIEITLQINTDTDDHKRWT